MIFIILLEVSFLNKKWELFRMTWKEIEEVFKEKPVVLIPMGSTEQQGPHTPTGDYRLTEQVVSEVCKRTETYCTSTIQFGCSEYFRNFPGTISFRHETMIAVLNDICQCFFDHGVTKLFFFNGHGGNAPVLDKVSRDIRRKHGYIIPSINLWQQIPLAKKLEVFEGENPSGHGAEPLTSVSSYLFPEEMRMDLFDSEMTSSKFLGFDIKSFDKVAMADIDFNVYLNANDVSPEGIVMGTPRFASCDRGKTLFENVVDRTSQIIEMWKKVSF